VVKEVRESEKMSTVKPDITVKPGIEVIFEDMGVRHLDEVLAIEKDSFPVPWLRHAFLYEILHNNVAHYVVALNDKEVIGYCGMWVIVDEAHVTNLAVRRDFRNRKIGSLLMKEMMRRAARKGVKKMTLEVRSSNLAARRLYENLGFKQFGLRKRYYVDNGEDAIIMWNHRLSEYSRPQVKSR